MAVAFVSLVLFPMAAATTSMIVGATATTSINIGVILGRDNRTVDTSDQEQWAVAQAQADVETMLTKATASSFALNLSVVFTGEDSESPSALAAVQQFLRASAAGGAGYVVGAYLAESALLKVRSMVDDLGLVLFAPASGLPTLAPPRRNIVRLWPSDKWQVEVFVKRMLAESKGHDIVILSRGDVSGRAFSNKLAASLPPHSLLPGLGGGPLYYNSTQGKSSFNPLVDKIRTAIRTSPTGTAVSFVCACGSDEIADILDTMRGGAGGGGGASPAAAPPASSAWPIDKTRFFLNDRATPTRSVVASHDRMEFAAAIHTRGLLSHLATTTNPRYESLRTRWAAAGHATSLFASALSAYDAVRIAALASVLLGGGNLTAAAGLRSAAVQIADQSWGASGMMTLDDSGDLYRAVYDVYEVDGKVGGWAVAGDPIDARAL